MLRSGPRRTRIELLHPAPKLFFLRLVLAVPTVLLPVLLGRARTLLVPPPSLHRAPDPIGHNTMVDVVEDELQRAGCTIAVPLDGSPYDGPKCPITWLIPFGALSPIVWCLEIAPIKDWSSVLLVGATILLMASMDLLLISIPL